MTEENNYPVQITLHLKDPAVHALLIEGRYLQILAVRRGDGEVIVTTVPKDENHKP